VNKPFAKLIQREKQPEEQNDFVNISTRAIDGVRVGSLVSARNKDQILVDYPGNPDRPLQARSIINLTAANENKEILLTFENGNPHLPIIVGLLQKHPVISKVSKEVLLDRETVKDIAIDGERIVFDAGKEIMLRCGEGSVKIRKDGKIIIKGTNIVSRAKGTNKIKGASVNIN
jgi:hypothetical protein